MLPRSLAVAFLALAPFTLPAADISGCPVQFLKVLPMAPQTVLANLAKPQGAPLGTDFVVQILNQSKKDIRGMKVQAAYFDATEDLHEIPIAWNSDRPIKAGEQKTLRWENNLYKDRANIGWIVVPVKILFEDATTWQSPFEASGCYGEFWKNKKHPRLTAIPQELVAAIQKASAKADDDAKSRTDGKK